MGTNTDSLDDGDRVEESYAETAQRWMNPRTTTVVLDEREDGTWFATQRGVDVVGQGETAAKAAAEYCRLIDDQEPAER